MDRRALSSVFSAALDAIEPAALVEAAIGRRQLKSIDQPITVLALGKAAAAMVVGLARVVAELRGVAVTPQRATLPSGVVGYVGSHPVPDRYSVIAGEALMAAAATAPSDGLVVCLLSGGGSALAEVPAAGLTIEDVADVTERLMRAGATIEELNSVRVAMSRIKGGGLAAAVESPHLITLAISDVGTASPAVIAAGPTLPAAAIDPLGVLGAYELHDVIAGRVGRIAGQFQGHDIADADFEIIADGETAARAAALAVAGSGGRPVTSSRVLGGEARVEARRIVSTSLDPGVVEIYWGETTVTVTGGGRGGRNHEAALAAAIELDGSPGVFLAGGTDGVDGYAVGAGAVVDGNTAAEGRDRGVDAAELLADNDSAAYFDVVSGRLGDGPTGTNVADLWMSSTDETYGTA